MSSEPRGVGSIPAEVLTNNGSSKCLRSLASAMLTVDWRIERFAAVVDTLRLVYRSLTIATTFRSRFFRMSLCIRRAAAFLFSAADEVFHVAVVFLADVFHQL